jgi:peroxiredoxin Q/BCP
MGLLSWLGVVNAGKPLELGDPAPDISATDENGEVVHLADACRAGFTLIYFFPKADTPGCTAQACSLRDEFDELADLGVKVFGVSTDSAAALRRFKEKRRLPFHLLTDEKRHLSVAFGVPTILGMAHRQSFLLRDGRLVWRDRRASTRWQGRDVLAAVNGLRG